MRVGHWRGSDARYHLLSFELFHLVVPDTLRVTTILGSLPILRRMG